MSIREDIVAKVVSDINAITGIKTVTREPKEITELSPASFPHVLVETANETREHAQFEGRRVADLDILLNVVVHGNNRDSARNTAFEQIEEKLQADPSLGDLCYDSYVTEVRIREIAQSAPYGSGAMIYRVRYFYDRENP